VFARRLFQRHRTIVQTLGTSLLAQGILAVSGVGAVRILGAGDRGRLALFNLVPTILVLLGTLGLPAAITYFIARDPGHTRAIIRSIGRRCIVLGAGLTALDIGILTAIEAHASARVLVAATASLPLVAFSILQVLGQSILQGQQRYTAFNWCRTLPNLVYAVLVGTIFATGTGTLLVVTSAFVAATVVVAIFTWLVVQRGLPERDTGTSSTAPNSKEMVGFGLRAVLGAVYPTETFQLDQAAVGLFLNPVSLGFYVVSVSFTNLPRFIAQSLGVIAYPRIAATTDRLETRRLILWFVIGSAIIAGVICIVLELSVGFLIPFVYGHRFTAAVTVTRILLISSFIVATRRTLSDSLRGAGFPMIGTIGETIALVCMLPMLAVMISLYGLKGAAVAVCISSSTGLVTNVLLGRRALRTTTTTELPIALMRCGRSVAGWAKRLQREPKQVLYGLAIVLGSAAVGAACTRIPPSISPLEVLVIPAAGFIFVALRRSQLINRQTLPVLAPEDMIARGAVFVLGIGLIFSTWNGVRITSSMTVSDPFLVLAGILALASRRKRLKVAPIWLVLPCLIILEEAFVDDLIYNVPLSGMLPGIRLAGAVALTPIVIGTVAGSFRSLWVLLDCWILSVGVNSFVAASDYLLHTHIGSSFTGEVALDRVAGLTTQPNHLGFVTVMALPVIISRLLTDRSNVARGYYAAVGVLAALALLSSGSRGGLLGGVFVIFATPLFQPRVRERAIVTFSAAAIVVLILGVFVLKGATFVTLQRSAGSATVQAAAGVNRSDSLRNQAYSQAYDQFSDHPINGVGFAHARAAQSLYLELLASGGVVAFLAFLSFLLGSTASGLRLSRTRGDPKLPGLAGATASSMGAWIIMGIAENQLYDRYLLVPCGFLLAVRLLLTATQRVDALEDTRVPVPMRAGA
jgi:O-antigen/teichoic acid export membrane protein